jgi:hypothetical protein
LNRLLPPDRIAAANQKWIEISCDGMYFDTHRFKVIGEALFQPQFQVFSETGRIMTEPDVD